MATETKAQDWNRIAAHYQNLTAYGWGDEMLTLVQHIISSGASNRLFAFTSLASLKISIYEMVDSTRETLHIDFDREKQVFLFRYYATEKYPEQPEFRRQYPRAVGVEKFDQFLQSIRW